MIEFIITYGAEIGFVLMIADKIVAKTPCKWDDLIFTAIKEAVSTILPKKS